MNGYTIRQIHPRDYAMIRMLDRDAFAHNERSSDGDFHEAYADNIRRSPYYIPELDLIAVSKDGSTYLGHAIFSMLPMGDQGEHIVWLNSLAVRHGDNDIHAEKRYAFQRKGIGSALVARGLEIAKLLGYTGCMTCGNPAIYRKKMSFMDYRALGIGKDDSVEDPEEAIHAMEIAPDGFDGTNRLLSYAYDDFTKSEDIVMKPDTLTHVLSKMLGETIVGASYQTKALHGGTLGDVRLVTGMAKILGGKEMPYCMVMKKQKKWERNGDPDSWRREYDLYASDLQTLFSETLRWPERYHAEMNETEDETTIWMEYIDGISGLALTGDMYKNAAHELGRLQGRLYAERPSMLQSIANLSGIGYAKSFYQHYRSWNVVYDYIRSSDCEIPKHLCEMLINFDEKSEEIFGRIEKLPAVLCHRDFWVANIFCQGDRIVLIDWDTAGWGYMGEDIASLIADEADIEHMAEHYHRCISAYYRGFSEYADVSHISDPCIRELILVMYGYRLVEWYIYAKSPEEKALQLDTLQKIYEIDQG